MLPDLKGKAILVCDIGGGTFDLSLVSVGAPGKPLDVIHAAHNNYAGDYVDALIVAEVCRAFNSQFHTSHPADAEEILELLNTESYPWLRKWFKEAKENWKEKISFSIEKTKDIHKIVPVKGNFDDGEHVLRFSMDMDTFNRCFIPFYENGRNLLNKFLHKLPQDIFPSAVVFSGGGSKIPGVREQIFEPVLTLLLGNRESAVECLERIPVNPRLVDRSIVLGAALIANGVVQVQEKLLADVGIIGSLPAAIANKLSIPEGVDILITPILKRGMSLPARIESHTLGINYKVKMGTTLLIQVVVDDDDEDPFVQEWVITLPHRKTETEPMERSLEWVMAADTDGVLMMTLKTANCEEKNWEGRFERKLSGRSWIIFGASPPGQESRFFRVRPDQIKTAREELNRLILKKEGHYVSAPR